MKLPAVKIIEHEKKAGFYKFAFTPAQLTEVQLFLEKHMKPGYVSLQLERPERFGTNRQNRLFHKLCSEYWRFISSMFTQESDIVDHYKSAADVKHQLKLKIKGVKTYMLSFDGHIKKYNAYEEVPEKFARYAVHEPYSWTEFNRQDRQKAIKLLIAEMEADGVNSQMFKDLIKERDELEKEMSQRKWI